MSDAPVRYGLIGYGLAGAAFHAPLIAATAGAELSVVVARSPQARQSVLDRYPDVAVVADVEAMANVGVDVGVVATPNETHAPIGHALISRGIATVVDKPLATTVAEGRDLIAAAEATDVLLTCYQNRRWDGDFLTVRRLYDDGSLGEIHRFESRFERWRPEVKPGWKERPGPGSGVLYDLGPHVVDQAIQLLGPVRSTYSEVRTLRADAQVTDDAFVALTHQSGAVSHLWTSMTAAAPGPRFRVLGSAGAYVKYGLDPQEDELRAGAIPGSVMWGSEPERDWGGLHTSGGVAPVATANGDYPAFYRQLTAAIRGDDSVPVDPRDSLETLRIIEQASSLV